MKNSLNQMLEKALLGFASGVMVAASVWSLLIPSMNMLENMGKLSVIPALTGFMSGIFFLLILDKITPHLHMNSEKPEGINVPLKKQQCLSLQ